MMPRCRVQQFTSFLLVVVILLAPTLCLCQEIHEIHGTDHQQVERSQASGHGSLGGCDQCPGIPGDDDGDAGHDASACFCSCHLPVTTQALRIHHVLLVSDLSIVERFTAIPEVYLPKFIPPQNQA